ncbi:hypothetical protein GGX14DRAFT_344328 [Mycena pura]|uniref:Smr domain-containing protein n=1 Tax=Mycena pura TaxID=153505 RepID=A0AAD6YVX3_9AGAR|nr:hypothetical protein GGX14DRAFT_344328 [Mycena pura]
MLADIDLESIQDSPSTSTPQIAALRSNLIELAAHADESQLALDNFSCSDETSSSPDFCTTTTTTSASDLQRSNSFNSPLGFLQATMPHIPIERLVMALSDVDDPDDDLDMWEIIATILSEETEKEMRERDLDEEEMNEIAPVAPWETAETKKAVRKAKKKGNKITLSDVRQQQHARPSASQPSRLRIDDPWVQLTSLSTHIANFLHPHPPSFFLSFFHSPEHARTPYHALCAALSAICASSPSDPDSHTATLYNLLDLFLPAYEDMDEDARTRLVSDVELALGAAQGRGEDAFELVKVLRDLDSDAMERHYNIGVYHSPVASLGDAHNAPTLRSATTALPDGPAATPPPKMKHTFTAPAPSGGKPSPFQWQAVPPRRRARNDAPYEHAMHIPTYHADVNGVRVRPRAGGGGNRFGKGGKGDVGELATYRRRVGESMRKRDELLREAARMWQRGNKRSRGGEVALYFAERAREFQEAVKREALDAARFRVQSKRFTSPDRDTIDLHGVTTAEAIEIVNEILREKTWSSEAPLKVITGRGAHSVGQVSVLKPAVRAALEQDGWVVGQWDGGLTVRGKRGLRGIS